ncbi:hypothetical protein SAZ10_29025 [Mesorhizobium sp. BAC0120]|uniref:hypothetical protein n=1 Tax=Mesorhizobium sp. BAC0120 TaxID=3090670 RepID=UPI00298C3B12|nr:hypothetical protein [Mesorhizobium sp. BAC0120]MDW6025814.1 hypothetical protein [Mesorhizobium sp. BAC0120]
METGSKGPKYKKRGIGVSMASFEFGGPPTGDAALDLLTECEQQLLPVVHEIVQSAVAVGWNEEDVLLALVELSWNMYEKRYDP